MTTIIEKIQKLQALADRAGTEHEAALAAQRVAELCQQHNMDIGMATLVAEEAEASESRHIHETRWEAHWWKLAQACNALFNVGSYRIGSGIPVKDSHGAVKSNKEGYALVFYGLRASVEAATVAYRYLLASVESLLEGYIREGHSLKGMSDLRSFRLGCAARIRRAAKDAMAATENHAQASEESLELALFSNTLIRTHKKKLGIRTVTRPAGPGNRDHYQAGYNAGERVDIHGARRTRMLR